jgi:hypothetical protein
MEDSQNVKLVTADGVTFSIPPEFHACSDHICSVVADSSEEETIPLMKISASTLQLIMTYA